MKFRKPRGSLLAPNDELITTRQAAELTNVSVAWYERMRLGTSGPPYIKRNRLVRYVRSELLAWWNEAKVPKPPSRSSRRK